MDFDTYRLLLQLQDATAASDLVGKFVGFERLLLKVTLEGGDEFVCVLFGLFAVGQLLLQVVHLPVLLLLLALKGRHFATHTFQLQQHTMIEINA